MNLDEFIDACESMKINEYDYAEEGLGKFIIGKMKKIGEKQNARLEAERQKTQKKSIPLTPEQTKTAKRFESEIEKFGIRIANTIRKKYKIVKPSFDVYDSDYDVYEGDNFITGVLSIEFTEDSFADFLDDNVYDKACDEYYSIEKEMRKALEEKFGVKTKDYGDGDEGIFTLIAQIK